MICGCQGDEIGDLLGRRRTEFLECCCSPFPNAVIVIPARGHEGRGGRRCRLPGSAEGFRGGGSGFRVGPRQPLDEGSDRRRRFRHGEWGGGWDGDSASSKSPLNHRPDDPPRSVFSRMPSGITPQPYSLREPGIQSDAAAPPKTAFHFHRYLQRNGRYSLMIFTLALHALTITRHETCDRQA